MHRMEASFRVWTPVSDLILCTGSAQHFGSTLKDSLGPPSICVPSSHMNLTHVVGAMIVVDRQGIICGDAWGGKRSFVLSPPCQRICSCKGDLVINSQ